MSDQVRAILSQSSAHVIENIAAFLPGLLALAVILVVTAAVGWLGRWLIRRSLQRMSFDKLIQRWGLFGVAEWSPARSPSAFVAGAAFWLIMLVGALFGLSVLGAALTTTLVVRLLNYLPDVCAAALILIVGVIVARFAARSVLISAVNLHIEWARLLSLGVKWLVIVLAGAMALEHLAIGGQIVRLAFGILFGGIVLALALAVGLGSKDTVSRSLERQAGRSREEEDSPVQHL